MSVLSTSYLVLREEEQKIKSFKELRVWRKGIEIVKDVYNLTGKFPKEEIYGLTSQMRRSAVSIPANIAEGFKRAHGREFKQFLHIAFGSVAELETQLILAVELSFIDSKETESLSEKLDHISKMLSALLAKISYEVRSTKDEVRGN